MIKKVNDSVWKKINLENQKKLNEHLDEIYGKNRKIDDNKYYFSSADDSNYSDSNFGLSQDEDFILESIENKIK